MGSRDMSPKVKTALVIGAVIILLLLFVVVNNAVLSWG